MPDINWRDTLWNLASVFSPSEAEAKVVARDSQAQALIDAVRSGAVMPEGQEPDPLVSGRFDPQKKAIYRNVLQAAQNRPETVNVFTIRRMPPGHERAAGVHYADADEIILREWDPFYSTQGKRYRGVIPTAVNYQDALSHELVHFLLQQITPELATQRYPPSFAGTFAAGTKADKQSSWNNLVPYMLGPPGRQHDFIEYLQGLAIAPAYEAPKGTWQPELTPFKYTPALHPEAAPPFPPDRDVYAAALRRIIQDPALLKQALQGLGR